MSSQPSTQGLINLRERIRFMSTHEPITCPRCGNTYLVLLIRESQSFNDFGIRHCPFCGRIGDQQGHDFFIERA